MALVLLRGCSNAKVGLTSHKVRVLSSTFECAGILKVAFAFAAVSCDILDLFLLAHSFRCLDCLPGDVRAGQADGKDHPAKLIQTLKSLPEPFSSRNAVVTSCTAAGVLDLKPIYFVSYNRKMCA